MIDVSCAVIIKDNKVLSVQRGQGRHLGGKWEFPGGKVHDGERPEDSVVREVAEELGLEVSVLRPLTPVTHSYPDKTVRLLPFLCRIEGGTLHLHEHQAFRWLSPHELGSLDWCEADGPILDEARRILA
ncbi:MAG: (deoxy)nucleoside triphosphate pyrophosphohydrolase [Nitrospiraceae bacterium]|nr:(deoxy)nucleoside triphosphate pyrophosphohydrolase [Nitrospiraceae bacterium]